VADLFEALRVSNIAALKALGTGSAPVGAPALRTKRWYPVEDSSVLSNGSGFPAWYRYLSTDGRAESLPGIVAHPSGGCFEISGGAAAPAAAGTEFVTTSPLSTRVPARIGETLIQTEAFGSRTTWVAKGLLNSNWVVTAGTPMIGSTSSSPNGSVTAIYMGQEFLALYSVGYGNFAAQKYVAVTAGGTQWVAL
jgi:hypothetical protein